MKGKWKSFGVFTNGRKLGKVKFKLEKNGYEVREKKVTLLEGRKRKKVKK